MNEITETINVPKFGEMTVTFKSPESAAAFKTVVESPEFKDYVESEYFATDLQAKGIPATMIDHLTA